MELYLYQGMKVYEYRNKTAATNRMYSKDLQFRSVNLDDIYSYSILGLVFSLLDDGSITFCSEGSKDVQGVDRHRLAVIDWLHDKGQDKLLCSGNHSQGCWQDFI